MPYKQYLGTEEMGPLRKGQKPTRPGQLGGGGSPTEAEQLKTKKAIYGPDAGADASIPGEPRDYSKMIKFKAGNTEYDNPPGDIATAKGTTPYAKGGTVKKYDKGGETDKEVAAPGWNARTAMHEKLNPTDRTAYEKEVPGGGPLAQKKGGPIKKYDRGGEVCPSNKKQMKQNLIETAVNPTE
jgi:hypothetical protein